MNETISREAGDKLKGPRLQKLRVIELMLDRIEASDNVQIYGCIEYKEDVYVKTVQTPASTDYLEENKNYSIGSGCSFNSKQVINTMVSFIDLYIKWSMSFKKVALNFYTTSKISKESTTKAISSLFLTLPDRPILELLKNGDFDTENLIPCVKALLINEYKVQYSGANKGNITIIENLTDEDWKNFLSTINWGFEEVNEVDLKTRVLNKIRNCSLFNHNLNGKEEVILAVLMEKIEERQNVSDVTEKFIHASDIKNVFLETEVRESIQKKEDPVWKMWESLTPSDKRNLEDKIKAVCENFNQKKINRLSRVVGRSLIEKDTFSTDRSFLSLRYRVFEKCEEQLLNEIANSQNLSEKQIEDILDKLRKCAKQEVAKLKSGFQYNVTDEIIIEGIVLELFDSCFLAFD